MRILHILNEIRQIGNGIVNVAVDLACLQAKIGHDVAVVSGGGEYENLLAEYGVKHFQLDQSRTPIKITKAALGYRKIIKEFQPEIVHAHMMTGIVLAKFLKGSSKYGLVSTVHNEFQRSAIAMGLANRVIAVSKPVAESMAKRGIPKQNLRVISNGTLGSVRTPGLTEYQPMELEHPAILTVAGMYRRKGVSELIEAFVEIAKDFPAVHLYLVGNGPDKEIFEAQAQDTSVGDRIHFEGFQPEAQRYMLGCDIFVLASHKDPSPLVIPEAREAGCAIIATNVDGIPEGLDNGEAGVLVPPVDSKSLAKALRKLLSSSEELHNWQVRAKQNLERLTLERVNQETITVYSELVNQL